MVFKAKINMCDLCTANPTGGSAASLMRVDCDVCFKSPARLKTLLSECNFCFKSPLRIKMKQHNISLKSLSKSSKFNFHETLLKPI